MQQQQEKLYLSLKSQKKVFLQKPNAQPPTLYTAP